MTSQKEPYEVRPCALCGYHAPTDECPHCAGAPAEVTLARPLRGPWTGILTGLWALPTGLRFLLRTGGLKRWLVPPLVLTSVVLVVVLAWAFSSLNELIDAMLPGRIELDPEWGWLERLGQRWGWVETLLAAGIGGLEWAVNSVWVLLTSQSLRWLGWFLVGSLITWYCFSIAYEALAGPFLDEVHARLEAGWFGGDPRSRLERPNDIESQRCVRLSALSLGLAALGAWGLLGLGLRPVWLFAVAPAAFAPAVLIDRRYGGWLLWVARIEGRALWASLQASALTALLVMLALPLYFVPGAGYFLFAGVTGFATAIGLLDIPFERRGWPLRERARFVVRNLAALVAFGACAGILLAVPVIGPVLMVPSASIGGLWLVCRLDKGPHRQARQRAS